MLFVFGWFEFSNTDLMDIDWWEWKGDLAHDIHNTLKLRENRLLRLKGGSKLLYWRRYLVDWLALTCQKFHLNCNAQHLSVCLYDRYTDRFDVVVEDLQMLVLCCLLIACKFEEREEKIPKFKILMEHLQWNLNVAFGERDMHAGKPMSNHEQANVYMEKNVNYFLEVSLQDQSFLVFKPSLVMASCIAASRICLHIAPTWTVELHKKSDFAWHHLVPCIEILLRLHEDDRQAMQSSIKTTPLSGGLSVLHQDGMNSTGNTPVTSPVPPTFRSSCYFKHQTGALFRPTYQIDKGFLV